MITTSSRLPVLVFMGLMLLSLTAVSQRVNSISSRLKPAEAVSQDAVDDSALFDTLRTSRASDAVAFCGYDKALRASRETLFVTNRMGADSILEVIWFTVEYFDSSRRQLHSRSQRVAVSVPSGDTRRIDFPSWDTQRSFFFYQNPPARTSAIPYWVTVRADSLMYSLCR